MSTEPLKILLKKEFATYMTACYAGMSLTPTQWIEIRRAFFSGIHWRNCAPLSLAQSNLLTQALKELVCDTP